MKKFLDPMRHHCCYGTIKVMDNQCIDITAQSTYFGAG
jgi:hypothetical protein